MKFTAKKEILVRELGKLQGVGERRQTMMILSNTLITAESGKISFLSTNMELGIQTSLEADVIEKGKTTANTRNLYEIIKRINSDIIEFDVEENNLKITGGKAEAKIPTMPASDFPKINIPEKKNAILLETPKFINMLDRVMFCSSTDETKYNLNSIFLDNGTNKGWLRAVSTDGHRLGISEQPVCSLEDMGVSKGILLPRKGAFELRKIMEMSPNINLMYDSGYLYMYSDNTIVFVKEMELDYPDYTRVIPSKNERIFRVKKDDMLSALDFVSLVSNIKSKTVVVSLSAGALVLSSKSPESGETVQEIEVDYSKDQIEIRFNSKYLMDILSSSKDDVLVFEVGDPLSPVLIKPDKVEYQENLYVIMPMRL